MRECHQTGVADALGDGHRARHRLHMRKRRVSADRPEPEDDGASPTKRLGLGKNVGVAVARIEAVETAAKQIG